jgi:hypothetical protein
MEHIGKQGKGTDSKPSSGFGDFSGEEADYLLSLIQDNGLPVCPFILCYACLCLFHINAVTKVVDYRRESW